MEPCTLSSKLNSAQSGCHSYSFCLIKHHVNCTVLSFVVNTAELDQCVSVDCWVSVRVAADVCFQFARISRDDAGLADMHKIKPV